MLKNDMDNASFNNVFEKKVIKLYFPCNWTRRPKLIAIFTDQRRISLKSFGRIKSKIKLSFRSIFSNNLAKREGRNFLLVSN